MKTTIIVCILLLLGAGCIEQPTEHRTVLLPDPTDSLHSKPDAEAILALYGLRENLWQGVTLTVSSISDVSVNRETVIALPSEHPLQGIETMRKLRIARFEQEVKKAVGSVPDKPAPRSVVYRTIATHLNSLSAQKQSRRTMLVYGDLQENSSISFYHPETLNALNTNPDSMRRVFEHILPLKDLTGINIYLIYEVPSWKEDGRYMIVSEFFKGLFESKGARVFIQHSFIPQP